MHKDIIKNLWEMYEIANNSEEGAYWITQGMDYLRLKTEKPCEILEEKLEYLNTSNTESCIIKFSNIDMTLVKIQSPTWHGVQCSISYQWVSVPIMYYEKYLEHNKTLFKAHWKVTLYGAYFRLDELKYFFFQWIKNESNLWQFGDWFVDEFGNCSITRIDYRVDFFSKNQKVDIFKPHNVTTIKTNTPIDYYNKGETIQWWRLWDRKSKRYLIRAYDKLEDINKKQKLKLYGQYLDYKTVHRLEFEYLNHFCKNTETWKSYTLRELRMLLEKIKAHIMSEDTGLPIFEPKEKVVLTDVSDRIKYVRNAKGYVKWCIDNRLNIFAIIMECYDELGLQEERINEDLDEFVNAHNKFSLFSHEKLKDVMS